MVPGGGTVIAGVMSTLGPMAGRWFRWWSVPPEGLGVDWGAEGRWSGRDSACHGRSGACGGRSWLFAVSAGGLVLLFFFT